MHNRNMKGIILLFLAIADVMAGAFLFSNPRGFLIWAVIAAIATTWIHHISIKIPYPGNKGPYYAVSVAFTLLFLIIGVILGYIWNMF